VGNPLDMLERTGLHGLSVGAAVAKGDFGVIGHG
jgi:hypothetical protein